MSGAGEPSFLPVESMREKLRSWSADAGLMRLIAEGWNVTLPGRVLTIALASFKEVYLFVAGEVLTVKIRGRGEPFEFAVPLAAFSDESERQKWVVELEAKKDANLASDRARELARWKAGETMSGMDVSAGR